jgi:RNA polymerase sigma factor (sigma-70 family)
LRRRPLRMHLSLHEPIGEEQESCMSERLADCGPSPEDECRHSELRWRVAQFLPRLSPPLRKAFQLRHLDGLTTGEAAHILGVPHGTLKAQVARASAKLRRFMRPALDGGRHSALPRTALPVVAKKGAECYPRFRAAN